MLPVYTLAVLYLALRTYAAPALIAATSSADLISVAAASSATAASTAAAPSIGTSLEAASSATVASASAESQTGGISSGAAASARVTFTAAASSTEITTVVTVSSTSGISAVVSSSVEITSSSATSSASDSSTTAAASLATNISPSAVSSTGATSMAIASLDHTTSTVAASPSNAKSEGVSSLSSVTLPAATSSAVVMSKLAPFTNSTSSATTTTTIRPTTLTSSPSTNTTLAFTSGSSSLLGFSATGTWTDIRCSASGITELGTPAPTKWAAAQASDALNEYISAWRQQSANSSSVKLEFPDYVWQVSGYNVGANCGDVADDICDITVQCTPSNKPDEPAAASIIINSLAAIHNVVKQAHEALSSARTDILSTTSTFANTFAKIPSTDKDLWIIEEVIDAVTFGLGVGMSTLLTTALKGAEEVASGIGKDIAMAGVAYATGAGKDSLPKAQSVFDEADSLDVLLQDYFTEFDTLQTEFLTNVTGLTDPSFDQTLKDFVNNGLALSLIDPAKANLFTDLERTAAQMLYGRLIPAAWKISQNNQNPFVLRVDRRDYKCGDPVANSGKLQLDLYMTDDTASKTHWCDGDGNTFFLLNAVKAGCPTSQPCDDPGMPFRALDGGDSTTLNSYNVTLQDIIISTYAGFQANSNRNGFPQTTNSSAIANNTFQVTDLGMPFAGNLATPGYFNFSVCLDVSQAVAGIYNNNLTSPCGDIPLAGDTSAPSNSHGYSPGWCGIHVEQFQRNEGPTNPTSNFELAITIKDSANQVIGYVPKTDATNALAVQSRLPFDVIVQAGANDNDPVCMWYADQWWCSNDQAHHCNFGGYEDGSRNGDCGFQCNDVTSTPPVSATKPLPATISTANPASSTVSNGGTTTPAPAPAKPTGHYAPGWCGVHVVQFQKNEPSNPINDYSLQITLYDDQKTLIDNTNQVRAPADVPISAQGPLPSPLNVTLGTVDSDPVLFAYGSANWAYADAAHHCDFGGYDNGQRQGDCGFTC